MDRGELRLLPLTGLPDFTPGDDVARALIRAAESLGGVEDGDVLVVAHKVVSKCEGALARLSDIEPSEFARSIAGTRDPRLIEVILQEQRTILRRRGSFLITETQHGFVCAGAGVDVSNAPDDNTVVLLPRDPDASARDLRTRLEQSTGRRLAVIISDSFGRAWRRGSVDVAIGAAGIKSIRDLRGDADQRGRALAMTLIAVADEIAAAAELVMGKARRIPAVIVRGVSDVLGEGCASELVRSRELDLFR